MSVPGVLGCHQIRTRGSADHVFLDLHVWLPPDMPLDDAHDAVARREGSADGALSADRRRGHPHRAAAAPAMQTSDESGLRLQLRIGTTDSTSWSSARRARRARRRSRRSSPSAIRPATASPRSATPGRGDVRRAVLCVAARRRNDLPSANLVFVQSRDGNTVDGDPSVLGGGEADKHLIYEGLSRVAADAVLAGARTIRGGDLVLSMWRPELVALRGRLPPRDALVSTPTLFDGPFYVSRAPSGTPVTRSCTRPSIRTRTRHAADPRTAAAQSRPDPLGRPATELRRAPDHLTRLPPSALLHQC